jgi:hypothetical protein
MLNFKEYYNTSLLQEAAKLTYAEFAKPKTGKRPDRKAIFLDKYENGQPFKVSKGGETKEVVFAIKPGIIKKIKSISIGNPDKKSEEFKRSKQLYDSIVLNDATNLDDEYSLNDLLKVKEFTGQGSGAGAANTKLNEASVCLWAAVYQEAREASSDVVSRLAKNSKVSNYYDVDEDVDKMIEQTDKAWLKHYTNVAEHLFNEVLDNKKYIFHRGSAVVRELYNKFNQLNRLLPEPFANANKWNPADIWAMSEELSESEFLGRIKAAPNLMGLNNILVELYKSKDFVGVSLKKTERTVHSTEYNIDLVKPQATLLSIVPGAGRKGIFAKDVYVKGAYSQQAGKGEEPYVIQFRSFNPWSDFQGEIKGKAAALGKVAHGVLNRILSKNGVETLPDLQYVRNLAADNKKNIDLLKEIFNGFVSLGGPLQDVKNVQEFIESVQSPDKNIVSEDYVFSKYFGIRFLQTLSSQNEKTKNKIMTDIIGYALSSSDSSGPFVKVH